MTATRLVVLFALLFAGLAPRSAHADDPATRASKRHYERGEKLFALGKFDEALDEYQKAFDAKPLPGFLFNIGQCYRNLGDYEQAIFSFKKYLKLEPDAPNRESVTQLIDELETKRARGEGEKLAAKTRPPPARGSTPIYKKWWFWTAIGAVAIGTSIGIYEGTRSSPPSTDLGNIVFRR